ncbi:MAG: methionyl-tRNA formyltransferase [Myxococcales bacterium]|nr:methionyl-tRNA formyltransferase [Myxococcales bacterium]
MKQQLPQRRLRLAFFGTPDIAKTVLAALLDAGEDDVVLVVSQPDRPKGRGKKLEPTPVKALAEARGIPVTQPTKLRDGALAAQLKALEVDLAIVVAYGRILPVDLFEAPTFHTWNVHASLLPRHRGASPIQHAILTGDAETGVTLMQLSEGMDEGAMLHTRAVPLDGTETTESLTEALAKLGGEALVEGLALAKAEGLEVTPQDEARVTYAPLIDKSAGALDFTRPAAELERRIRAFFPWPGCFVPLSDGPLKILAAQVVGGSGAAPGTLTALKPLTVETGEGALVITQLQPPGKKPMDAAAYLNGAGRGLVVGTRWSSVTAD